MKRIKNNVLIILVVAATTFFIPKNIQAFTGIDVSQHNGYIDWNKVKTDNINDVIIKATEGVDWKDPKLNVYYNGAKNEGFNIGFYHFFSERTSPTRQAEDFYNAIKDKNYNITPVLDVETNVYNRNSFELTNRCIEFLNRFKEISGQDCMIYTGGFFGLTELDYRIKGYKAWIAHYGVSKPMATGFINLAGHQYSETGRVNGIVGNVDMNNFYDNIYLSNEIVVNALSKNVAKSQTYGKIAELQRICNVEDDNIYGPVTDAAIQSLPLAGLPYKTPQLTTWIQLRLGINADGIFGPATEEAVKDWQSSHGLSVDGIAGYNTIKSLALA